MPQCYQSIIINAPIERVWDTVKDFHDCSWAAGVIDRCEAVGKLGGTETGARRILNGVFYETLLEFNPSIHCIRYSTDDGPSPVSPNEVRNYVGILQLHPISANNGTFVEWRTSWESQSEEAHDFCDLICATLLRALAKRLEHSSAAK
jgi:hypothetical protein